MDKIECPECCGEGYDFEIQIDSKFPATIICEVCDGLGWVEQPIFCVTCNRQVSGFDIDPNDPEYEEIVERLATCSNCVEKIIITDSTTTTGTVNITGAAVGGSNTINSNFLFVDRSLNLV